MKCCPWCGIKFEVINRKTGRQFGGHIVTCSKNPNRTAIYLAHKPKIFRLCEYCDKKFQVQYFTHRFCSQSCSAKTVQKGHIHSVETKAKIRNTLKIKHALKPPKPKVTKPRKSCIICGAEKPSRKKYYCTNCRTEILPAYQIASRFIFNVYDYPTWFDLDLLKKYGWYQPVNRGNNLKGVSRDHRLSVIQGFHQGIEPQLLAHPANCRLILHSENQRKRQKSSLTLEELKQDILKFEQEVGARPGS